MATVDVNKLEDLKEKIEALSKFQQVEILKILSKNMCKLNENKSGKIGRASCRKECRSRWSPYH